MIQHSPNMLGANLLNNLAKLLSNKFVMNNKKLVKRQLPLLPLRNPRKRNLARTSFGRKHALSIVVKFSIYLLCAKQLASYT